MDLHTETLRPPATGIVLKNQSSSWSGDSARRSVSWFIRQIDVESSTLQVHVARSGNISFVARKALDLRLVDGELLMDIDGRGSLPLTPVSTTRVSVRLFELEFWPDEHGVITAAEIIPAGVRIVRK